MGPLKDQPKIATDVNGVETWWTGAGGRRGGPISLAQGRLMHDNGPGGKEKVGTPRDGDGKQKGGGSASIFRQKGEKGLAKNFLTQRVGKSRTEGGGGRGGGEVRTRKAEAIGIQRRKGGGAEINHGGTKVNI